MNDSPRDAPDGGPPLVPRFDRHIPCAAPESSLVPEAAARRRPMDEVLVVHE